VVLVLLLAGCGGVEGGADGGVTVPVTGGSASVPAGETLRVELGNADPVAGDSWHLVVPPDAAVLIDTGQVPDAAEWRFTAAAPGTTALVFRYCHRSEPPACQPMPERGPADPVTLTVTVR
jgi:predicted secreted protein